IQNTAFPYPITGSPAITLNNSTGDGTARITVAATATTHQHIQTPLSAAGPVLVTNDSPTGVLFLDGNVALGGNTMTVTGAGTVSLGTNAGFSGPAGSLVVKEGAGLLRLNGFYNSGPK